MRVLNTKFTLGRQFESVLHIFIGLSKTLKNLMIFSKLAVVSDNFVTSRLLVLNDMQTLFDRGSTCIVWYWAWKKIII